MSKFVSMIKITGVLRSRDLFFTDLRSSLFYIFVTCYIIRYYFSYLFSHFKIKFIFKHTETSSSSNTYSFDCFRYFMIRSNCLHKGIFVVMARLAVWYSISRVLLNNGLLQVKFNKKLINII